MSTPCSNGYSSCDRPPMNIRGIRVTFFLNVLREFQVRNMVLRCSAGHMYQFQDTSPKCRTWFCDVPRDTSVTRSSVSDPRYQDHQTVSIGTYYVQHTLSLDQCNCPLDFDAVSNLCSCSFFPFPFLLDLSLVSPPPSGFQSVSTL